MGGPVVRCKVGELPNVKAQLQPSSIKASEASTRLIGCLLQRFLGSDLDIGRGSRRRWYRLSLGTQAVEMKRDGLLL